MLSRNCATTKLHGYGIFRHVLYRWDSGDCSHHRRMDGRGEQRASQPATALSDESQQVGAARAAPTWGWGRLVIEPLSCPRVAGVPACT